MFSIDPYPPLNVLKPIADDVWIVDGPVVHMRYGIGTLPFSTRMTIVRLRGGRLWIHSPTELTDDLKAAVAGLGEVAFLIAPNRLHWVYLGAWQTAFPAVETHVAPKVEANADEGGFRVDRMLAAEPAEGWAGEIDQVLVPGSFMTEVDFFHRPSRTLVLTDLIENFEADHVHGLLSETVMGIGGVLDPHGSTPRDLRMTFLAHKAEVRQAAEVMVGWAPERVILSHGRCYLDNGTEELRRALAWTGLEAAVSGRREP